MIVYTPDQIFDLLGAISCQTDLIEVEHYVISYSKFYSGIDLVLFTICINDLNEIFK